MNRTAAGVFDTYSAAGNVVRELELLGISGEQVEVVSDAAHDVRGAGVLPRKTQEKSASSDADYTLVIVRPSDDAGMEQAKTLMDRYGAKLFRWQISAESAPIEDDVVGTTPETSIGGPGTVGADPTDLPGRGVQMDIQKSGVPEIPHKFHN
jgi:hypothetical protein